MSVKISGGLLCGRVIRFPTVSGVRPTSARVRESIFSALEVLGILPGAHVLDLFSGSGVLGFEALSRDAASVHFVEKSQSLADAITVNSEELGLQTDVRVYVGEVLNLLPKLTSARPYSLVMLDPPYEQDRAQRVVVRVIEELCTAQLCSSSAVIVAEQSTKIEALDEILVGSHTFATRFWHRSYGDTAVSFYKIHNGEAA